MAYDLTRPDVAAARGRARSSSGYLVAPFPNQMLARDLIINPRRGPTLSVPWLDFQDQIKIQDQLFGQFGLDDLVGCTTAEMRSRPVPHVFEATKTKALTDLYVKWLPLIFARIIGELHPPTQVFNKTSRMGWPVFGRAQFKKEACLKFFQLVRDGDFGFFENCFHTINVRLQAESRAKERDFLFIARDGLVYPRRIDEKARTFKSKKLGATRIASRTRLVFNLPVPNLYAQCFDTAVHNTLLKKASFHHNMYDPTLAPFSGPTMFFDVKHFERATAGAVRARSALMGGKYGQIGDLFANAPFLCPSDDWKVAWLLWVDRESGWSDQFASGYSPVAPVQKEIFWALLAEFAVRTFGMSPDAALDWAAGGGDHRIRIKNYGDDNAYAGDEKALSDCFSFLKQYLDVELEDPPKFLGFLHRVDGWKLGVRSYLEKTWLNERPPFSTFRKFPNYGWVLKRQIYKKFGVPELAKEVFPAEDDLLAAAGMPWSEVERAATLEEATAKQFTALTLDSLVHDKDWLMTAEEKLKTGMFEGLTPDETAPIIKDLLSEEWLKRLAW